MKLKGVSAIVLVMLGLGQLLSFCADKVTITYFSWGLSEVVWGGWLQQVVAEFERLHPNIKVELQSTTFADKERVYLTRAEAGVAPDVADFPFDSIALFAQRGYLLDLFSLIAGEEAGFIDTWDDAAVKALTLGGKLVMMPMILMPWVLVYNSRMFANAGLDPCSPPATIEELIKCAVALTRDTDNDGVIDQWGFGMTAARATGFFSRFSAFLWSAGGDYLTEDWSSSALAKPESLQGIRNFVELATKYRVTHPGEVYLTVQDVRTLMANEKVAMVVETGFAPGIIHGINPNLGAFSILQFAPFPSYQGLPVYVQPTLVGQVISSQTKHPKEAWELVKFINSYDIQLSAWHVNGWVSARKDVRSSAAITEDKFGRILAQEAPRMKLPPLIPEWPEISDVVITAIQEILTGTKPLEAAVTEADRKINEILSRR